MLNKRIRVSTQWNGPLKYRLTFLSNKFVIKLSPLNIPYSPRIFTERSVALREQSLDPVASTRRQAQINQTTQHEGELGALRDVDEPDCSLRLSCLSNSLRL